MRFALSAMAQEVLPQV